MSSRSFLRGVRRPAAVLLLAAAALLVLSAAPSAAQAEGDGAAPPAGAASYPESGDHLVRVGDTLYGIARETLGNGARYTEIFELNEGVPQDVGGALTDPAVLRVGWVLRLPPLDPNQGGPDDGEDADDSPGSGVGYTVQRGDTLYGIAEAQLGDGSRYDEIFAINQGRPQVGGGTLTDPSVLQVGWVLELPDAAAPAPPAEQTATYTVRPGDTLYGIARETLGDGARYTEIFELNEGVPQAVGGTLTDPSVLRVGWVLQLPAA